MRLAVFTNQFPARVNTFFSRDMRGLLDAGVDVEIFAIYPLDETLWRWVPTLLDEHVLPRHKVHHLSTVETLRPRHVWPPANARGFLEQTIRIGAASFSDGLMPFAKTSYVVPRAWTWARQFPHRYDHVLAYWGNYSATCALLFRQLLPSQVPFSIFLHAGIDLYLHRVFLREKLLAARRIITCSDFNRKFIETHFPDIWPTIADRVYVHYHGLDLPAFPFHEGRRHSRKIVAVGRIDAFKGFEYLLAAVGRLRETNVDCELQIVGDGSERESLRRLAEDLGITDRVTFTGWVRPEEVPGIVSEAAMLVHPSSRLGDGVPNVIKEAMAVGTPVIGSEIAGIPELLKDGDIGLLVPPRDVAALADAIRRLLLDSALREKYSRLARSHVVNSFDLWRNGRHLANALRNGGPAAAVSA